VNERQTLISILVLLATVLSSCGKTPESASSGEQAEHASAAAAPISTKTVEACKLITADEMTALAGKPIQANADEGVGRTGCVWEPAGGGFPRVELKIEWGMAEAAMTASGMLAKHEPGISNPYEGLGDEAVVMGPAVMIKRDEDLFTIIVSGVDEPDAAVRKIYDTATARL
jgi:hypothetical protein